MQNDRLLKFLLKVALILVIILIFNNLRDFFHPVLETFNMLITPLIISLFLYYMMRPVVRRLEKAKVHRGLMVLTVILSFVFFLVVFLIYGGNSLKNQFQNEFVNNLNKSIDIEGFLQGIIKFIPDGILPDNFNVTNEILNRFRNVILDFSRKFLGYVSKLGDIGTQAILIPFILFYLLKDDRIFYKKLISILPKTYITEIKEAIKNIDRILSIYISSQLLVSFILGVLMFIGYLIIGLPNALLMAFLAMITNIIPFLGPFLGAFPAVLIAMTIDMKMVLKVIILAVVVQQAEGDLITPKIIGDKLQLHPLEVILIILISVNLFGVFGAFIGVPLYLILSIIVKAVSDIVKKRRREKYE
ncbi:MAG TPA: AI-2E family transporter [Tissierellia bacterium]|nr:AI-2E family transporter [Tissierellia bacterium]